MKNKKNRDLYKLLLFEKYFHKIILPFFAVIIFIGLFFTIYQKIKIKDFFLIILASFTLLSFVFSYIQKYHNLRSEYIDKLVYKWHSTIIEIIKDKNSLFQYINDIEGYNKLQPNSTTKILINGQFQFAIDIISLIYKEITSPDFPSENKNEIIMAWKNTFYDTLFKYSLPRILFMEKKNTIDRETKEFISEIIKSSESKT